MLSSGILKLLHEKEEKLKLKLKDQVLDLPKARSLRRSFKRTNGYHKTRSPASKHMNNLRVSIFKGVINVKFRVTRLVYQ